jgi:microcystin-dependent protein
MERGNVMKNSSSRISRLRAAFFMPSLCAAAIALFLSVYPPSISRAQFADQSTAAGTSTGSANAYAITINNWFAPLPLVPLRFIPNFTNTGPATINVSGLGNVAILRPSSIGLVALSGQELLIGEPTSVEWNGTNYVLSSNVDMTPIGRTVEFRGATTPRGTLIEDGSCVSQTTYAALFSVIGSTYGSCSAGLFALPDSRGTGFVALDGQGVNGSANRITTASCATPNAVGICGHETYTILTTNLPPYTPSGSVATTNSGVFAQSGNGGSSAPITSSGNGFGAVIATSIFTGNAQGGASTPHPILNPTLLGRRAIKT